MSIEERDEELAADEPSAPTSDLLAEWEDFAARAIRKARRKGLKAADAKNLAIAAAVGVDKVKALADRPARRVDVAPVRPDLPRLALALARLAERYLVSESPISSR